MRRGLGSRLLHIVSHERGALFWVPGLLLATYLVLFGISQVPTGPSLYTRTTSLRIVVGPWRSARGSAADCAALVTALRRGLTRHGELAVVDSVRVAERLNAEPPGEDLGRFLRAIRPLNPHVAVGGSIEPDSDALRAHLEAWDAHSGRRLLEIAVRGSRAGELGLALAESLQAAVFLPHSVAAAAR